ncbi:MAG: hexose kinase [Sphingomicrobium sp.]
MACPTVRTLTLNPSIDMSGDVAAIAPVVKLRMTGEEVDAGGGGINVARVLHRLETSVEAVYLAGGANGHTLSHVLERMGLPHEAVAIAGDSRLSLTVHEGSTGQEYRFVPQGPEVSDAEVERALAAATDCISPWFVASGSLPRGVSADIYARIRARLPADVRFVIDTSGAALGPALAAGGLYLVKASGEEFAEATGRSYADQAEVAVAARALVAAGKTAIVAVSFAEAGAILVDATGAWSIPAADVVARSTVGAGDSFLAGMVHALAADMGSIEALRWATAAGAATVGRVGTGLCTAAEVMAMLTLVPQPAPMTI